MQPVQSLPVPVRALLAGARRKEADLIAFARRLVVAESASGEKSAVDACMALAADQAKRLGGRVRIHRQRRFGNLLEARFGPRTRSAGQGHGRSVKPILLLGHIDTVWPLDTLRTMPCRIREGRLSGPGALDMKAGVAMAFSALEILLEADLLNREIVLLLVSDEEVGSPVSRPVTEELARQCAAVYVLEPAQGLAYKTARKGVGTWRVEISGGAAHAGVDFDKGASSIRELARIVETVSAWTDPGRGLTVNVGVAAGGTQSNVVAARAHAEIDARFARRADGPRLERRFAALRVADRRSTLSVTGGVIRPPMQRTAGTVRLYQTARAFARELGFALPEASTGGASDGNFTSALGIPTLDGMGAVGEGAHARHESVDLTHLAPRTALLAVMLIAAPA
jgi:glutamate carboxypeptidase